MKRPAWSSYLLGYSPIAFGLMAAGALCTYLWWAGQLGGGVALASVVVAAWASRAREELMRYRAWCAQWNRQETGPHAAAPARRARTGHIAGVLIAATGWFYLFYVAQTGGTRQVLMGMAVGLLATLPVIVVWVVHRRRRVDGSNATTRRANQSWVLVAVVAPHHPVPSLHHAVQALPDYCHALLRHTSTSAPTQGRPRNG